ncbi:MAG: nucleotide exchange factor GrpE [Firmicutes bacterium]|nr:nucleotide exchange factor GrpE [Bacillota bacterium]
MTSNEEVKEKAEEELKDQEIPEEDTAEQPAGDEAAGEKAESEKPEEKPEAGKNPEQTAEQVESERYQRLFAEFSNYKRRTEKEKSDLYAYAGEKFAKGLLDVIDNFERAMDAKPEGDKFADGMELILVQLKGVLEKNNVEEIKALGEPFDPNFHNAVMTEAVEGTESGIVTRVMQKGYTLNGKVIRPAMVAVSQ